MFFFLGALTPTRNQFAGTAVKPNYVTFHGFEADEGAQLHLTPTRPSHRVEFLGDSITAGFDNCCDVPNYPKGKLFRRGFYDFMILLWFMTLDP